MEIRIIKDLIEKAELQRIADEWKSEFVKGVVDIAQGIMAIGAEFHADEEEILIAEGSKREDCWGINLFPQKAKEDWIAFDSLINIKPVQNNRSLHVEDRATRERINMIVYKLIKD